VPVGTVGWALGRFDRHDELKGRAALAVGGGGKFAAVMLDDHAADGQAQAHSVRLGGDEGAEYLVQPARLDAGAGVFHRDRNGVASARLAAHAQYPRPVGRGAHGFDRVLHQVENDFLDLPAMTVDQWQLGQLDAALDRAILQFAAERLEHPAHDLVDV